MKEAFSYAKKSMQLGEVPVGAILVDSDKKIIAGSGNSMISSSDPTAHAEINVLRLAGKILKNYRLSDDHPIKKAVNYKQAFDFLRGKYPEDVMQDKSLFATRQLAKRQDTWMRGWEEYTELKDGNPKILLNSVKNLVSSL